MRLCFSVFFLLFLSISSSAKELVLHNETQITDVKQHGSFFYDIDGQIYTKQQFIDQPSLLKPYSELSQFPNRGLYSRWLKLELYNKSNKSNWYLSFGYARLPMVNVYWEKAQNHESVASLNASSRFYDRPIIDPQMYIPIVIKPGERKTLYVEFQTFANAPANIQLHDYKHYLKNSQQRSAINGTLIGVITAVLLLVVLNLFFNKNKANSFYVIWTFLFLLIVIDMSGFTFQYLWPERGDFAGLFSIFLMLSVPIAHLLFITNFLQLKIYHVKLAYLYAVLICGYGLLIPIGLWLETVFFNLLLSTLAIPIFLYTCWWSWRQPAPGARVFTVSLICHVLFLNVFTILGVSYGNFFNSVEISYYIKIGYLIEVCLFTVAMALQHKSVQTQLVTRLQDQINALNQSIRHEQSEVEKHRSFVKEKEEKLFTDLSHELRTPLTVMKVQVESLQHNIVENVDATYGKLMDKIEELNQFVNALMLSSSESNLTSALTFKQSSLGEFINETYQQGTFILKSQQHQLRLYKQIHNMTYIEMDANSIQKVILECIKNASSHNNDPLFIELSFVQRVNHLLIKIEDSGRPLNYELHQTIFQPLFRKDISRNSNNGNKGMGLTLCKKIVEAHKGTIEARNSHLGGLCIEIKIPKPDLSFANCVTET